MTPQLPQVPRHRRANWALRMICVKVNDDVMCENFTSVVGSCHFYGRRPDSGYTSERWCNSCIAYFGLHGSFPVRIVD
jgi:hypothetical protein